MIRELLVAAAITGTAVGLAPAAADPGYDGDVPGMNYRRFSGCALRQL